MHTYIAKMFDYFSLAKHLGLYHKSLIVIKQSTQK